MRRDRMDYYLPTLAVERIFRGRRTRGERVAFPRYLIVGLDPLLPAFGCVRDVDGVVGLLGQGGTPQPVPTALLMAMDAELCKGDADAAALAIGQAVTVGTGTMAGFLAVVTGLLSSDRVRVEVEMFRQRVPVEMEVGDLKAA
jgi:transcription antitermination factor NusG